MKWYNVRNVITIDKVFGMINIKMLDDIVRLC